MKNLLVVFVCLLFASTGFAQDGNQAEDYNSAISSIESSPIWQVLEKLTASERANAIIDIECEEIAEEEASLIEEKWNSGNYSEAIELLKDSPELVDEAIGIQWKNPIRISSRWGNDVRIGTRDSIVVVDLDVDNVTGNLLVVLRYDSLGFRRWAVNISTDTGKTWIETFNWISTGTLDVDGAVIGNYFYVAYSATVGTGRMRRFNASDGNIDIGYGYLTVIDEGVGLRDITLTSTADAPSPIDYFLLYFAIMENDSLRLYWSDANGTTWNGTFDPPVGNADRGLDAFCAVTPNTNMWVSYISTSDSLCVVGGWDFWTNYGPLAYTGISSYYVTSIGAYGDTVIAVYPYRRNADSNYVQYRITYNGGTNWAVGELYGPSDTLSIVNDVTARLGDGFGVVYQTAGSTAEGFYRHGSYLLPIWSAPFSFADNVPHGIVKPSIERIASGIYGIVYVNWPEEMAWFDRSDWVSGIDEDITDENTVSLLALSPVVFSSQITVSYYLPDGDNSDMSLDIYDVTGRHIKTLARGMPAGSHSTTWFGEGENGKKVPSGVYFCVLKAGGITQSSKTTLIK